MPCYSVYSNQIEEDTCCRERLPYTLQSSLLVIHKLKVDVLIFSCEMTRMFYPQNQTGRTLTPYTATYNDAVSYGAKIGSSRVLAEQGTETNHVAFRSFKGTYVASTLRASDWQCCAHAISYFQMRCEQSTSRPNFLPVWLIKYGGNSRFSLSNSVVLSERGTKML